MIRAAAVSSLFTILVAAGCIAYAFVNGRREMQRQVESTGPMFEALLQ